VLADISRIVQHGSVQLDPGVRLKAASALANANPQIGDNPAAAQEPPQGQRPRQARGPVGTTSRGSVNDPCDGPSLLDLGSPV
jgi:hypothetical protein